MRCRRHVLYQQTGPFSWTHRDHHRPQPSLPPHACRRGNFNTNFTTTPVTDPTTASADTLPSEFPDPLSQVEFVEFSVTLTAMRRLGIDAFLHIHPCNSLLEMKYFHYYYCNSTNKPCSFPPRLQTLIGKTNPVSHFKRDDAPRNQSLRVVPPCGVGPCTMHSHNNISRFPTWMIL